ncbi:four helix bundle protein [Marinifilum caeruleilacunae]|uniref:Four helix bundle protein n=1 Tax=Marinifilum caeruleilacunae TaxID=2499076 RepID=A0ABX1WRZ4_9BACT|nr:four helix bundle protein [Marinifilum caeruleilacunae]NOU58869.1 four helix bundle protein [Marinifilum caeruleilacunae]
MPQKEFHNVIVEKSYAFAIRIVKLCQYLNKEKREFVLSRQLMKSGTSVGANIEEAIGGISKKDFISKMSIAYKEARETNYWIRLLNDTEYIEEKLFKSLDHDNQELLKILFSIINSSRTENS